MLEGRFAHTGRVRRPTDLLEVDVPPQCAGGLPEPAWDPESRAMVPCHCGSSPRSSRAPRETPERLFPCGLREIAIIPLTSLSVLKWPSTFHELGPARDGALGARAATRARALLPWLGRERAGVSAALPPCRGERSRLQLRACSVSRYRYRSSNTLAGRHLDVGITVPLYPQCDMWCVSEVPLNFQVFCGVVPTVRTVLVRDPRSARLQVLSVEPAQEFYDVVQLCARASPQLPRGGRNPRMRVEALTVVERFSFAVRALLSWDGTDAYATKQLVLTISIHLARSGCVLKPDFHRVGAAPWRAAASCARAERIAGARCLSVPCKTPSASGCDDSNNTLNTQLNFQSLTHLKTWQKRASLPTYSEPRTRHQSRLRYGSLILGQAFIVFSVYRFCKQDELKAAIGGAYTLIFFTHTCALIVAQVRKSSPWNAWNAMFPVAFGLLTCAYASYAFLKMQAAKAPRE